MNTQACPNCHRLHDIAVYVTGQRILCRCGIHFEVQRTDVSSPELRPRPSAGIAHSRVRSAAGGSHGTEPQVPGDPTTPVSDKTFISTSARLEIPGYDLIEILGRGGMGEVWRAHQRSLGRVVAIKILPPKQAKDLDSIARFEKEATALASLSHPHIVQIIDRGIAGDNYYFVMEYVQGVSLRERINSRRPNPSEVVKWVLQICQAIDYAHEKQIIHRDLKPENILLDERGYAKVADFGLAGIGNSTGRMDLTATSVAMGTVNYMAPEQRRDAKNVDRRADLYSLGVILYELLTGELPIGRFRLPSQRVPGLDPRFDAVAAKALEADPSARHASASLMARELESMVSSDRASSEASAAETGSAPSSSSKPLPRTESKPKALLLTGWRGLQVALGVVGALAVIGLAIRWAFGPVTLEIGKQHTGLVLGASHEEQAHFQKHGHLGAGRFPPNTNGPLLVSSRALTHNGLTELTISFVPGEEELMAYAGSWLLDDGKLKATQAGSDSGGHKLIPRAYLSQRHFSSDDFSAEVEMTLLDLEKDFPTEENAQHFAELAFRFKDLQVSIFAIDDMTMRLLWRYFTDTAEVTGNSSRDSEHLLEDEMPVPPDGTSFRVRLSLKRHLRGTEVEGFLNGERFARKILNGLEGKTGRATLGCRNLHCEFRNLSVRGKAVPLRAGIQLAAERPE